MCRAGRQRAGSGGPEGSGTGAGSRRRTRASEYGKNVNANRGGQAAEPGRETVAALGERHFFRLISG